MLDFLEQAISHFPSFFAGFTIASTLTIIVRKIRRNRKFQLWRLKKELKKLNEEYDAASGEEDRLAMKNLYGGKYYLDAKAEQRYFGEKIKEVEEHINWLEKEK